MKSLILFFALIAVSAMAGETLAQDDLTKAYRKEFAFLEAEKRALTNRLEELDAESAKKLGQAQAEVEQLQRQILGMRAQADDIEMELNDVERQTMSAEERSDLINETIERGFESLARLGFEHKIELTEDRAGQAEQVEQLFLIAARAIEQSSAIRTEEGSFFLDDGTQSKGRIIKIGNVAAYGVNDKAAGALAPAGANRYKIWPEPAADTAKALAAGGEPRTMAAFLFESLEKGIEEKKAKTPLDVIRSGGIIAWVIVGLGVLGLLMIIVRLLILFLASSRTDRLLREVSELMSQGNAAKALDVCKEAKGAAARVLKSTIRNLDRDREHLEDIVSEAILHEAPFVERFGSTILVIAAVAPLLGLLGTVTGMISTFDVITEFGTGDPKMLSGGISEALVTTELGLIVAIPTLLIGTLLTGRANGIMQSMERAALQVMNLGGDPDIKERLSKSKPKPKPKSKSKPEDGGKKSDAKAQPQVAREPA